MISLNNDLKAVLAYERNLLKVKLKVDVNKKDGMHFMPATNKNGFARELSLGLLELFKVPVFSMNDFAERHDILPIYIPSMVFNYESLKKAKESIKKEIKSEEHKKAISSKNKNLNPYIKAENIEYILNEMNRFSKVQKGVYHEYLDEMISNNEGIILKVTEAIGYYNISFVTKERNLSYTITKSESMDLDIELALQKIDLFMKE